MISHEHRCIFIHIPKCAGQSVETAFLEDLGLTWDTRAVLLLRPNDCPDIGPPRLGHLIARDYMRHHYISRELFRRYLKFSIVRNPWARAVSTYRYLDANESFSDFVNSTLTKSLAVGEADGNFWFFRPQIDYVSDERGEIIVDQILPFERLADGFEKIAVAIGLKTALRHINKSTPGLIRQDATTAPAAIHRKAFAGVQRRLMSARRSISLLNARTKGAGWRDFYDEHTRARIADLYASDITTFGYTFDRDEPSVGETSQ